MAMHSLLAVSHSSTWLIPRRLYWPRGGEFITGGKLDNRSSAANLTGQIYSSRIMILDGHMILKKHFETQTALLFVLVFSIGGCAHN